MKLLCPIKKGVPRNWSKNTDLHNLDELFRCQNQGFGGNGEYYQSNGINIVGHNGLDFGYENGTEVYAAHDGMVSNQIDDRSGKGVVLTTQGYKSIYWHLRDYALPDGSKVKAGDLIGYGDSTGFSTGPHLHFGLKLLDINNQVLNRDNGYDGAIDPTPYIVWELINTMSEKDIRSLQALEGYSDEDGVKYWTGKNLSDYLAVRLADKVKTIQEIL